MMNTNMLYFEYPHSCLVHNCSQRLQEVPVMYSMSGLSLHSYWILLSMLDCCCWFRASSILSFSSPACQQQIRTITLSRDPCTVQYYMQEAMQLSNTFGKGEQAGSHDPPKAPSTAFILPNAALLPTSTLQSTSGGIPCVFTQAEAFSVLL